MPNYKKAIKIKIIIITTLALLFSACTTPHIENTNNVLEITMNKTSIIKGRGELIYKSRVNLVNINIDQKVYLMDNGSVLTYEDAPLSSGYTYNYGMRRTVGIIFSQYSYNLVSTKGNIYFFKLTDKERTLYLILENINKKRVKMVYGLSSKVFEAIADSLNTEKNLLLEDSSVHNSIHKDKSIYIKSNWNTKNIVLDNIITKMGGGPKVRM